MTGPEHYRAAEEHLNLSGSKPPHASAYHLARAEVHARLALAAATALKNMTDVVSPASAVSIAESWRATVMGGSGENGAT